MQNQWLFIINVEDLLKSIRQINLKSYRNRYVPNFLNDYNL